MLNISVDVKKKVLPSVLFNRDDANSFCGKVEGDLLIASFKCNGANSDDVKNNYLQSGLFKCNDAVAPVEGTLDV